MLTSLESRISSSSSPSLGLDSMTMVNTQCDRDERSFCLRISSDQQRLVLLTQSVAPILRPTFPFSKRSITSCGLETTSSTRGATYTFP